MDVFKESLNRLISPYLFWKAYFSKESYERDQKISDTLNHWVEGGLALYGIIIGVTLLMLGNTAESSLAVKIFGVFIVITHILLQFTFGKTARKRYLNRKIEEKIGKINQWFYERLKEAYEEERETFNDTSNHQFQFEDDWYNGSKEEFFQENYHENSNHFEEILERFNLPKGTNDMVVIKKRYRELAKRYHPDMETGDANLFIQIVADFEYMKFHFEQEAS